MLIARWTVIVCQLGGVTYHKYFNKHTALRFKANIDRLDSTMFTVLVKGRVKTITINNKNSEELHDKHTTSCGRCEK